jgi:hypothetical protein
MTRGVFCPVGEWEEVEEEEEEEEEEKVECAIVICLS